MVDKRNAEIISEKRVYTAEQDFQGNGKNVGGYSDEQAQDAVGNNVGDGLSYDDPSGSVAFNVVASADGAALSSGSLTVDTGVSTTETATFIPAIGPDTDDADIAAEVRSDSASGNYEVDFVETADTSVGNPTIDYDIIRVR